MSIIYVISALLKCIYSIQTLVLAVILLMIYCMCDVVCYYQLHVEPHYCSAFVHTTCVSTWNKRAVGCQEPHAAVERECDSVE